MGLRRSSPSSVICPPRCELPASCSNLTHIAWRSEACSQTRGQANPPQAASLLLLQTRADLRGIVMKAAATAFACRDAGA